MFRETELYPTPKNVIELMLQGEDITNKVILEPSGGIGNIVDVLYKRGAKTVLACEENEDLRKILQTKCNVICNDFLTLESDKISHIDYIIMNPPFSSADKHILHAYKIAPAGCKIIALCNINTLENDYSEIRKRLKNIILENGKYENIGNVFHDADRKTGVDIALIKIQKAGVNYNTEFEGFFLDDDEPELQANAVMPYNVIRDLVNRYVAAVKIFDEQLASAVKMNNLTSGFFSGGVGMNISVEQKPIKRDEFIKSLQKSGWNFIFQKMNMSKYATRGLKEDINKFVEQQQKIPFTMKNIYRMLEIVVGTQSQRMDKALIEVFDKVTKHYDENRFNVEGWKTNSYYLVNRRFIIPYMVKVGYRGEVDTNYGSAETIEDFVKALCYITGDNYSDMISLDSYIRYPYKLVKDGKYISEENYEWVKITARDYEYDKIQRLKEEYHGSEIEHSVVTWGQWFEWGYFRCKAYKKGTMHFEFKDEDVWMRFNQAVARIQGNPLPESMKPKESKKKDKSVKTEKQIINPIDMNLTKSEISENPTLAMETLNNELSTAKQQLEIANEGDEKQFVETKIKRIEAEIELVKESVIPKFDIGETVYMTWNGAALYVKNRYVDTDGKYKYNLSDTGKDSISFKGVEEAKLLSVAEQKDIATEKEITRIKAEEEEAIAKEQREKEEKEAEIKHIEGKREYIKKKISVFETLLKMADKKDKPFLQKKINVFKTLLKMEVEEMACGGSLFGCGGEMKRGGGIRSISEYNKLWVEKDNIVKNLTPEQVAKMWNENSKSVKKGISEPMTLEYAKGDNAKMYLRNMLVENELTEEEYNTYFEDGGNIPSYNERTDFIEYTKSNETDSTGKHIKLTLKHGSGEETIIKIYDKGVVEGKNIIALNVSKVDAKPKEFNGTMDEAIAEIAGNAKEVEKFEGGGVGEDIIAKSTMQTKDGEIEGIVRWNPLWKKYQVYIDGSLHGEYDESIDGIKELKNAGFKDVDVDLPFGKGGGVEKGNKIGFEKLQHQVAKEYKGKKVPIKYQKEYGKEYDKQEAEEVGKKVAAKVYHEQQLVQDGKVALYCKRGMKLQTILIPKENYSLKEAKEWLKKNGFKYTNVDKAKNFYRFRQIDPSDFLKKPYETNVWKGGIKAVFACPKKK